MKRAVLGIMAALAFGAAAAAQDFVVTASPLAEPGPGRMVPADTTIKLGAGQVMELVGPGGPLKIAGPYEGAIGAAAGATQTASASPLGDLVKRRERMRALGASRNSGGGGPTEASFQLLADPAWCVGGAKPELFLAPAKADRVVTLISSDGKRAEMLWPANKATQPWPDAAPFSAGARYKVAVGDVEMPGGFELKAGPKGASAGERLAGYISAGCHAQAEAEMEKLGG